MKKYRAWFKRFMDLPGCRGFTLLEVMVALVLATIMIGGVMGSISTSLQYSHRVKQKGVGLPIIEAAAQELLAHPEKAEDESLALEGLPDEPEVDIFLTEVNRPDGTTYENRYGRLYRVQLKYEGNVLELSLMVPKSGLF